MKNIKWLFVGMLLLVVSFVLAGCGGGGGSSSPSPTYSISGSVNGGGGALPGATITLGGAAIGTTTTDATGAYTFSNLAANTYTVTPSLTGWTFSPASSSQTITNANKTGVNFTATSAVASYSISGTVIYSGSKPGTIHVNIMYSGGGVNGTGTSISAPGSFTIRGVQPGSYQIYAWRDTLNNGIQDVVNPTGTSITYNVTSANITGASVTMTDPSLPAPSTPTGFGVSPVSGGAIIGWNSIQNPNGNGDGASSYKIYWGTDGVNFPNSVTVPETDNGVYFQSGLTDGQVLYYRMTSLINTTESSPSTVFGPVTIGAPTGGVSVSGQVTFSGSAAGHRLWVGIVDQSKSNGNKSNIYGTFITSPTSPASFTVTGVQPGTYFLFAFVDMDDNGYFGLGDKLPNFRAMPTFTVAGTNITGKSITLPNTNSVSAVNTIHDLHGTNHSYNVDFRIRDIMKRADKATVMSGPNIPLPLDLGRFYNNLQDNISLGTTAPTIGDAYTVNVTYSDGTSETVTVSVTGLVGTSNLATPVSPTGVISDTTPTFTWSAPLSAPAGGYTYDVTIQPQNGGNWIWSYPDNGPYGMLSSQLSVLYNTDGSAHQSALTPGTNYDWWIAVNDSNGNVGQNHATFSISFSISGTVTNNNANKSSNILIGACTDSTFTTCNYGIGMAPGAGGSYTITNIPNGIYYVGACVDADNDNACNGTDPGAAYASNPVTISNGNVSGINITIP